MTVESRSAAEPLTAPSPSSPVVGEETNPPVALTAGNTEMWLGGMDLPGMDADEEID